MTTQIEGVRVQGLILKELLTNDFVSELNDSLKEFDAVALILMKKEGNGNPIILNHQNAKEVQEKVLHLECQNADTLQKITKIIEKRVPKK